MAWTSHMNWNDTGDAYAVSEVSIIDETESTLTVEFSWGTHGTNGYNGGPDNYGIDCKAEYWVNDASVSAWERHTEGVYQSGALVASGKYRMTIQKPLLKPETHHFMNTCEGKSVGGFPAYGGDNPYDYSFRKDVAITVPVRTPVPPSNPTLLADKKYVKDNSETIHITCIKAENPGSDDFSSFKYIDGLGNPIRTKSPKVPEFDYEVSQAFYNGVGNIDNYYKKCIVPNKKPRCLYIGATEWHGILSSDTVWVEIHYGTGNITIYDENGDAHNGVMTVYNDKGDGCNVIINLFDKDGNIHSA